MRTFSCDKNCSAAKFVFIAFLFSALCLFGSPGEASASVQVVTGKAWGTLSGTKYLGIGGYTNLGSADNSNSNNTLIPVAGSFSSLRAASDYVPGGSDTVTITLRKNSVDTALTCTITSAATTCSDIANSVSVSAGDKLTYKIVWSATSQAGHVTVASDFSPTTANDTFFTTLTGTLSSSLQRYVAISPFSFNVGASATEIRAVIPESGTLDKFVASTTAPGAGTAWNFTLMKNTATTTLTCQIDGNAPGKCNDNTNTVSVTAGDLLNIATVPTGTPVSTGLGAGMRFVPSTAGNFNFVTIGDNTSSNTATNYFPISGLSFGNSTLEASTTQVTNSMTVTSIFVSISTAPGSGKSRVFTLRKNSTDTALTCTIADSATTCSATNSISVADGDMLSTTNAPSGTPTNSRASISLIASRPAASAPTVTTQSASSVTSGTATLNGTITALGGANVTVSGFAYGTDSALATVIATTTGSGATSTVPALISADISSLACNTAYYFRPYATNSAGTGLGTIETFTTSACSPPTVTTQSASSVEGSAATLNGTITALGGANVTVSGFAYGTDSALATVIATTTGSGATSTVPALISAAVSSLSCGTTYYFRPYATNSVGTGLGSIQTFTTTTCALSPYFIPSRITGVAPLAVFFDTASSTSVHTTNFAFTDKPFHELDYSWSFGDTTAGNWTYGTASTSKNVAYGPIAAHVFETPGVYTVNLTVYNGTDTVATTTTITVTDPDTVFSGTNTVCIANSTPVAGSGGCPAGASTPTGTSDFDAALASCLGNGKRCLFNRGDTFLLGTETNLSTNSSWTIGDYGTGAKPVVNIAAGVNAFVFNAAASDGRILNLELVGSGATETTSLCVDVSGSPTGIVLKGIVCRDVGRGMSVATGQVVTNFFLVSSVIKNYYDVSGGNAFFGYAAYSAFLDNELGPSYGEHVLRLQQGKNVVISNNLMTTPAITKGALIIRANAHVTSANDTQYVYVSDNKLDAGSLGTYVMTTRPTNDSRLDLIYDVIVERNWFISGGSTAAAYSISASRVTVRNNVFDLSDALTHVGVSIDTGTGDQATPSPVPYSDGNTVYNNTFFSANTDSDFIAVKLTGKCFSCSIGPNRPVTNTSIKNNLAYAPYDSDHILFSISDDDDNITSASTVGASGTYGNSSDLQVLSTNPLFASTTPSYSFPYDYKLNVGSYAISGATTSPTVPGVFRDFFNTLRQATPSIGAWDLNAPTITTQAASSVADTTATANGTITITGGVNSTTRGFAYGTSPTLATAATTTGSGSFGTGAFTGSLSGLSSATVYYFRPYATNSVGTSYGSIQTFTTTGSATAPTVTTQSASSLAQTSATLNGTVTALGGANVTVSGFAYGTDSALATVIATTTDGGTASSVPTSFTSAVSSLTCNTAYYFRPYATNSAGTGLGTIDTFTTSTCSSGGGSSSQSGTITVTLSII